jgi:hypothetical protein
VLVNLAYVRRLRYLHDHRYRFELEGGTRLTSGRSFKARIAGIAVDPDVGG